MLESVDLNYLPIILMPIASMIIGMVWYHKAVFGKQWMKLLGKKEEELKSQSKFGYVVSIVAAWMIAYVMAHIVDFAGATTFTDGLLTGLWTWVGFVAPTMAVNYTFKLQRKKLFLIDVGQHLVFFLVAGVVLTLWV